MSTLSREEIVSILSRSTHDVFSTMLGLQLTEQPARFEQSDPQPVHGVVALVGIGGAWTGSGRVYCSAAMACKLAGALLMTEFANVDEEVLDAIGEIGNMIIGSAKTSLEETLGPLGLSVPTVIFGKNYQARSAAVRDWTVIGFECESEIVDVRFCLFPARAMPHHAPPSEAAYHPAEPITRS